MPDSMEDYKRLAEAALFVSGKAMSVDELAKALGIASVGAIPGMLAELTSEYEKNNSALGIFKIGDRYVMGVKEPYASKVNSLAGKPDLSSGALRILAYVSKNEPVIQSSVVKTFGSTSYDYIKELVGKDFISTKRSGRSKSIQTTQRFREYFNV
jgi:segregation and condensation protein B